MSHPPLLFLDVDGVLNTSMMQTSHNSKLHPKLLKRLSTLINTSNTKVVLSTTWRRDEGYKSILIDYLRSNGVDVENVVEGDTPVLSPAAGGEAPSSVRVREISAYLSEAGIPHDTPIAVLDDMDLKNIEALDGLIKFIKVS
eukprot:CAMPEP_0118661096 /NCGR_PEP_ID=MMETSP0785-20121206/16085_1 /TAXON_ID=91992 /ORGANISM="Bolidomonas pacifica, Strain CCMP 1866" /LENGTH=141 /DNA_ID=CAMNT_0006554489 /DNA_START=44 /DNA_END=466 /DNA_ORIENTATION=-